ncbi:MAG: hypothetical protein ACFFHD_05895 [Promethearchaeota archaeon]
MNALEPLEYYFKKKIAILGGMETYKDELQKRMSSDCLPIENKKNIGVNISKIEFIFNLKNKFEFLLWNIDCRQQRAFLRTVFYNGADAIIILISETKIIQIIQYMNEIQSRLPEVTLIFCIILENISKDEIMELYFKNEQFGDLIDTNSIEINEITDPKEILNQISQICITKACEKESENNYIIDFISRNLLFRNLMIHDHCNDYYEPNSTKIKIRKKIDTELLIKYIEKSNLGVYYKPINWIKIKNENFGTFSVYLKNGNVYYFPKICETCKDKKCIKYKKAPYFICIEVTESFGWTNINGFSQNELVILAKIFALKEGNENILPKSIMKQIKKLNKCEKNKKFK